MTQNFVGIQPSDHDINSVWGIRATSPTTQGFRLSVASTLLNHLVICIHQPEDVHERARLDPLCTKSTSPSHGRRGSNTRAVTDHQMLLLAPQAAGPSRSPIPSPLQIPALSMLPLDQSGPGSPALTEGSSLRPDDSFSVASSQSSHGLRVLLSRSSSLRLAALNAPINSQQSVPINIGPIWTTERQAMFENRLARLTASAGLPLAWVDNVEWLLFLQDFLPAATPISRKVSHKLVGPSPYSRVTRK